MTRYCRTHTQGKIPFDAINYRSCRRFLNPFSYWIFLIIKTFPDPLAPLLMIWLKIWNIAYAHLVFARIYCWYCTTFRIEEIYDFPRLPIETSSYAYEYSCYWSNFFHNNRRTCQIHKIKLIWTDSATNFEVVSKINKIFKNDLLNKRFFENTIMTISKSS